MDISFVPPGATNDEFDTAYQGHRDQWDGGAWQQHLATSRRPMAVQTLQDVQALVAEIAPRHGVDPKLVQSVIGLESGGNPLAISQKGAQGVMQLMPSTAKRFGVRDPLDPQQNIEGGIRYLAFLKSQFPGRTDLQLAAYHAGEGAVRNAGYSIPQTSDGTMTTQQYVQTILSRYQAPQMEDVSQRAQGSSQPGPGPQSPPQQPTAPGSVQLMGTALPGVATPAPVEQPMLPDQVAPTAGLDPMATPFPPLEPGVSEPRGGRMLGAIAAGGVSLVKGLFNAVVAGENLVGLTRPDAPGMSDPMGAELVVNLLDKVQQDVGERRGGQPPDFFDKLGYGIGTSLGSLLPGAAALRFLRGVGTVAPTVARWGAAATSGVIESASEAGSLFEQTKALVGEDEAAKRALMSFGQNVVLVTATDRLGIFGDQASLLRRMLAGIVTNGAQEEVQYDIERRQLWVPSTHQAAEALKQHGWVDDGERLIRPYSPKDAGEAALIGMIIGGPASAAVGLAAQDVSTPWQTLTAREREAAGGEVDPQFSLMNVFKAAQNQPAPEGVEPETWQRWGQYLKDLLPQSTGGAGLLGSQRGAVGGGGRFLGGQGQPTLRGGAEGIPQEQYRTPSGDWVIPRKDIPLTELELKDFIGEMKGIKLDGEELEGELRAVISPSETGIRGLQNNVRGVSLQEMAETAQQYEFIRTADKEALLEALDRSVNLNQPVYSMQATGRIPLIHDPHVSGTYQAVLDAVELMQERTQEQVGGVRARAERHAEARELIATGQFTPDDIREIFPNTTLNDTMASALVQSLHDIAVNLGNAADAYLQNGARIGSQEETSLQQTMALLAELDPTRLGVSAAQSRGLSILNDPLSGYTQYLNKLHHVLATSSERTMEHIAQKIVAARPQPAKTSEYWREHPEELAAQFADMQAVIAEFAASQRPFQLEADEPETLLGVTRTPEEHALIAAAYTPTGPARTPEEWNQVFRANAQAKLLAAWQAGAFERARAQQAQLPDLLELNRQREAQRQRAMEDWTAADRARDETYAQAREVWAQQAVERAHARWQQGIRDFRALQAELRAGYPGRPVGLPPREGEPHRPATQMTLLDEFQEVQQHLTAYLAGRATQDQEARLMALLQPWQAAQEQLTLPTLKAALQTTKPGFEEYFLELWFNALLSNPATHITNALSNVATTAWALPERFVAEQFSHGQAGGVARGEATAMLYGLTHGVQGSWAGAVRAWKLGRPVSGLGRETTREPALTATTLGLDPESGLGKFADFFFNYVGLASGGRIPGRALMAADEFFKLWNYAGELNALAYREAVRQGYEGPAFAGHAARVVSSPTLGELQQAAKDFSVMQTFQTPIEPGSWGATAQRWADIRMPIKWTDQTFPVGRVLIPFVQTPVNIATYAVERTPLGAALGTYKADIEAGGARADLAHAKITLGTFAMVAMAGFALAGRLTGRGPEDPELRAIWLESHPAYSVRLPTGHWMSYQWLGPLGQLLGFVADAVQVAGEASIPWYTKMVAAPLYSFLKNIGNQTYMGQLNEFFDAMWPGYGTTPAQFIKGMQRFGLRRLAGIAQPSAFLNVGARALDPAEKEATDFYNMVYSRIPGWGGFGRSGVPSRRTLGGEKVLYGMGFDPEVLANTVRAYAPMKLGDGLIYPADKEILEHKMALNKPSRSLVPHALPPGMQAQGLSEVDLSDYGGLRLDDQQYEKLGVLAGGNQVEAKKLGLQLPNDLLEAVVDGLSRGFTGTPPRATRSLDEYLDWMITTPEYREASPGPGGGKEAFFQQAVRTYRMVGLQLLLSQDDALRERYEESQIQMQTKQLPLGQRHEVIEEMRGGYREAAPRAREELGLRVGGP